MQAKHTTRCSRSVHSQMQQNDPPPDPHKPNAPNPAILRTQIRLPHLRQRSGIAALHQIPIRDHKKRIPFHKPLPIQPRQHDVQKRRVRSLVPERHGRKLRQPQRFAHRRIHRVEIGLQGRSLGLGGAAIPAVPVAGHEIVDAFAGAGGVEGLQPGDTHERRGGVGVGDGGGAEPGGAGEGLHVRDPAGGGVGRGQGAAAVLGRFVRLVEAHDGSVRGGEVRERGFGLRHEAVLLPVQAPEHGDVVERAGQAGGRRAPVVAPADRRLRGEWRAERGGVVDDAALGAGRGGVR